MVCIFISVPVVVTIISLHVLYLDSKTNALVLSIVGLFSLVIQLSNCASASLSLFISLIIYMLAINFYAIWIFLKNISEYIANSWREWTFGKVRVINHGFYVGIGAFIGIMLAGILAGKYYSWAVLVFAIVVVIFSALWAQVIEGSEKLKRPYGYYGALVGIIFGSIAVWAMGFDVWIIIGVISVVMPWVQAIGRLRCLINGCCHGKAVDKESLGIRYFHSRSRVTNLSNLKGQLLHPTPLYSILWLFFVGLLLLILWYSDFSSPFIFGIYLILTGLGRFVEEGYRGEVQTPIIRGLRLYQWTAILSIIIGIFMTTIRINPVFVDPEFGWEVIAASLIGGLFTTFAMGIDFPDSNVRFSRLV